MRPLKVYAGYSKDKDIRMNSSSGAVFNSLASYVLDKEGIIYGVAMSKECYSAEYVRVTNVENLSRIRGSKYMQAHIGDAYRQVRNDLMSGKLVLFSGTGCQINGLKNFLGEEYEKLICVDVICHGVPSPALWKKYAMYQEKKNEGKLKSITFRCKDDNYEGFWMKHIGGKTPKKNRKKLYIPQDADPYMQMFLNDYCLRPSCYMCVAKNTKMSDITIADFWGIDSVAPEMNDGRGTSLVIIRTDLGNSIFNIISDEMKLKEVSYEDGVRDNPAEFKSALRPAERDVFFDDMHNMNFKELEKKYVIPRRASIKSKIKKKIGDVIRKIFRINNKKKYVDYGLLFVFQV